jgi:hypothetical protein
VEFGIRFDFSNAHRTSVLTISLMMGVATMTTRVQSWRASHILLVCITMLFLLRPAVSFAFASKPSSARQWSKSALGMVRNRGLEVRREGATPMGEEGQRFDHISIFRFFLVVSCPNLFIILFQRAA